MQKVLYITNVPSPYRIDFFNELGKLCNLTVLFEATHSGERYKQWHKYDFKQFNAVFLRGIRVRADDSLSVQVMKFLKRGLFDIVVVGGYSTPTGMLAIIVSNMRGIPFILNADGGFIRKSESFTKRKLKTYFIKSANAWLSTGRKTNEYLFYYGANPERTYIYHFTSMHQDEILARLPTCKDKREHKDKLGIKYDKMVLSVGRFVYDKGFDVLIHACKGFPKNWGVYLVGGEATEEYKNLVEANDMTNVHFVGFKSKKELTEYYMAADLFVLPTRYDVWGLVINEAMSFGLPIITTDMCIAGMELVVDGFNGFIVPVGNVEELRDRMVYVLSDDSISSKMGESSLRVASKYTIQNMVLDHIRVFKEISDNLGEATRR